LVFVFSFIPVLRSQYWQIDDLMKIKPSGIGTQRVDTTVAVFLPMPFSQANFADLSQLKKIPSPASVYSVHLVYTRFREVDSFNQPKLNFFRFTELQKIYPAIFEDSEVEWKVLEQREAKTKDRAARCFHGFVLYLKNEPPPELLKREISTMTNIIDSYRDTLVWIPEKIDWKVKRRKVETGYYVPRNEKKRKAGEKYTSSGIWFREPEYEVFYDSSIRKKTGGYWQKTGRFDTSTFRGTDEFNFLTRRKWSPKMAVVTDVTGSMGPFSTQVMLWLKYNSEILKQGRFAFFNDGNGTPDPFKRIGSSGGIYFAPTGNFDSVFSVMKYTMSKGLGGDIPENNLEAVLKTLQHWPDTDTVLLIADNQAAVKDMALLSKIDKPVSVMVCGMFNNIHPDYVNIAKTTGGKLFVLDTEISNLKGLQSGTRILIGGKWFEWRKGTFVSAAGWH
jgi:hypothetical protein